MASFEHSIHQASIGLSDDQLRQELACAERCAVECTRTLREMARLRAVCLRRELERRAMRESVVLASGRLAPVPA